MRNTNSSWAIVIIAFVVFWPAGIYLLYKKLISGDRTAKLNDGKMMRIIGIILLVAGIYQLFQVIIGERYYSVSFLVFYFAGGIALVVIGDQMKKSSIRYRQYIDFVANQQIRDLDVMAGMVGVSYEVCVKDIQKMIDSGFFHDTYIDHGRKQVIMQPRVAVPVMQPPPYQSAPIYQAPAGPRVVSCKSCGANNTVMGAVSECEYCGSPLA